MSTILKFQQLKSIKINILKLKISKQSYINVHNNKKV